MIVADFRLMRNQSLYYQAVLFIDVMLFISYGETIILAQH